MKLLFLTIAFLFVGCTSTPAPSPVTTVVCDVETSLTSVLSQTIGTTLSCINVAQINVDVLAALGKANLCPAVTSAAAIKAQIAKPQGVVGSIVCPLAVNAVFGLASSKIPASWGCSPTAQVATLSSVLSAACIAAVPI